MKLIENSTITLYKMPFVDSNLFDFHDNSVNYEEFSTNFHAALFTFATAVNRILLSLSDVRAIKISDTSLQITLPIKKSRLEGFTLIECKTNELHGGYTEYVYFNIDTITSLNDNDSNPSCKLFCSINYYYSYLFDIQISMANTQVNFETHHVKRYTLTSGHNTAVINYGVEGCTGVTFTQHVIRVDYAGDGVRRDNILWLYVVLDEDVKFRTKVGTNVYEGPQTLKFYSEFSDNQTVMAMPIGSITDDGVELLHSIKFDYTVDGQSYTETIDNPALGIENGNNIIDAYISNQKPSFDYQVTNLTIDGQKFPQVVIKGLPLRAYQEVASAGRVYATASYAALCSNGTFVLKNVNGNDTLTTTIINLHKGRTTNIEDFANTNSNRQQLSDFSYAVLNDPAFGLYPFTYIGTICGEFIYYPSRFGEKFSINTNSYLRSINFVCKSEINNKQIFYINSWSQPSSFARLSKDVMTTFYRNNSGQYRVKMTTDRAKSFVQIATGLDVAKYNMYARGRAGFDYFDTRSLMNTLVSGGMTGQQGMNLNASGAMFQANAIRAAGSVANGVIDLVSSHAMKNARDYDMANSQNDYQNIASNQYGDCQTFIKMYYTPNKDSEEFKQLAYQIYYYGYPREEIGIAGDNNRIIYDYKKVSAIYSEITNNSSVSEYMKIILLNGATFWHLENLASLTSDQKRQIITTANKYGIANYEPNSN